MWAAATPGDEVGGYRIVARLGQGATGAVYRAEDGGGHPVAIKVLHAGPDTDESARARLAREAATLRRLDHPAVAAVLDVELEGESPFIVTELVDGTSLEDDVARHGAYDADRLASLAGSLADALEAVHTAGVVHRDLKPSNIMVTARGPVLIDFGIAHGFEDARMTTEGLVMGTPGYLAPEMLTGASPSVATDWWGWAASPRLRCDRPRALRGDARRRRARPGAGRVRGPAGARAAAGGRDRRRAAARPRGALGARRRRRRAAQGRRRRRRARSRLARRPRGDRRPRRRVAVAHAGRDPRPPHRARQRRPGRAPSPRTSRRPRRPPPTRPR